MEDECVQCQGNCSFEYAINFNKGEMAELPNKAAQIFANVKCAVCGRGKGNLPLHNSLFEIDNQNVHITAVKRADNGDGIIVRMFNPTEKPQKVNLKAQKCRMDETVLGDFDGVIEAKKIVTLRIDK